MSLTAISAPRLICSPKEAYCPVMGPTVEILISALAEPVLTIVKAAAAISVLLKFRIYGLLPAFMKGWRL